MPIKHIQQLGENETGLHCIIHRQDVYTRRDVGLLKYFHTNDDSPCETLNSLNVTGHEIIAAIGERASLEATPLNCVCFLYSDRARKNCYAELGAATKLHELIQALHTILKWVDDKPEKQKIVFQELGVVFGGVVLDNLEMVAKQVNYPVTSFATYRRHVALIPTYKMPDLKELQKQTALKNLATKGKVGQAAVNTNAAKRAKALSGGK